MNKCGFQWSVFQAMEVTGALTKNRSVFSQRRSILDVWLESEYASDWHLFLFHRNQCRYCWWFTGKFREVYPQKARYINSEAEEYTLCEKCPYSEFFWSVFSRIRTEYEGIRRKYAPEKLQIRSLFTQW